jgi:regulator of protease activity HflC (stomatin/prohibitin superfamily)
MEKKSNSLPAIIAVFIQIGLVAFSVYNIYDNWDAAGLVSTWAAPSVCFILALFLFNGYVVLEPNEAAVISFMGKYKGTLKDNGLSFVNPFYSTIYCSLKVSNYAMEPLKVNDKNGVPIEIAATIVWMIGDTYKAQYDVEDLDEYIDNQFEISLRTLAKNHSYSELSTEEKDFVVDITDKVSKAGVIILDAKITHLNYAPEIASAMLQKQQASSLSEAKEIIVSNAVDIASGAAISIRNMTELQRISFVANLVLVLCSDKGVTPTINVNNNQENKV